MFNEGMWTSDINVRDFIVRNYQPYDGDETFLSSATPNTLKLWEEVKALMIKERDAGGVLDIDEHTVSNVNAFEPGYINKDLEVIVGLQTDAPLKRAILPYGGIRTVEKSLEAYGRKLPENVREIFKHRKTHNDGVFDVYTKEIRAARSSGIITGLPDAYGRGRIIGDYRRVALYGVDTLIEKKRESKREYTFAAMDEGVIRHREELSDQIRTLEELKEMAARYGFDISHPASDTKEAVQWLYFAYLAAIKDQNGAAMSLGRVSTFLDIYAQRDLADGRYTEDEIQEIFDHFIIKLRMVRFLRTPAYDELFSGDPTWVTESLAGMCVDGRHMVTKSTFRFLHSLVNLGPAPEPNMTVLWSTRLPEPFKNFCARLSCETSSIQYENDDVMSEKFGDDYGIACCVSPMRIGKQMQFFGARVNLAKALLYAINGGRDEVSGKQVAPPIAPITSEVLDYTEVRERYAQICEWLATLYVNTLNTIHYMHDKYCYEKLQMALHDEDILRTMACGVAGLSVVADSLSAIKYAKVKPIRNSDGLAVDFEIDGEYPAFGNNDPRVDEIAQSIVTKFMTRLRRQRTYRNSKPTMSILTITSNVVYGKKTGTTPDGRKKGEPFAPGANPMHGRDKHGPVASLASVASLPFDYSEDGISYTFSIVPGALGKSVDQRIGNLVNLLDGFFMEHGHHVNVNVIDREVLKDAMEHPELYPQLTIRVSGYAVNFVKLSREQQLDVINRTFHTFMQKVILLNQNNAENLKNITGIIHHTESFGAVDGPGIRFVFFLQGCSLRCLYCHNADAIPRAGGNIWTAKQAADEVLRYKSFISSGGVTFSGGEPLVQPEFVTAVSKLLHEKGIHTALDTAGCEDPDRPEIKAAIDESDLIMLDIKAVDSPTAIRLTGRDTVNAWKTLDYCEASGKSVWIRHVLLREYTLDKEKLHTLASRLSKYKCIQRIELLPFHKLGESKWQALGWKYDLFGTAATTMDELARAKEIFINAGFVVQ